MTTVKETLTRPWLPAALVVGGLVAAIGFNAAPAQVPSAAPAAATSDAAPHSDKRIGDIFRRTELYFGSQRPSGAPVGDAQFDAFVDTYVTPRFPDGLTQLTGEGQFNGSTGPIEEKSFVVVLLYPLDDKSANKEIEAIRRDYKKLFQQESVLRADSLDRVSF